MQLHHLCSGTEAGASAQDALTTNEAASNALREELADDLHTRDDAVIKNDIAVTTADNIVHQNHCNEELSKLKRASDYLAYILAHSTKTASEPNHYICLLDQSRNGFELKLGDFFVSATAVDIVLAPTHCYRTSLQACTPLDRTTSTSSIQNIDGRHLPL